jgi:hypothetical protein
LSPSFFAIYIDDVIREIVSRNLGCIVYGVCVGIVLYADDILLISSSVYELQLMVNICIQQLDNLDLCVNAKKSMCLRIGRRHNACCADVLLKQEPVKWVNEIRYLGVFLLKGTHFRCNFEQNRKRFFRAANSILGKIGTKNVSVTLSLIFTYCVPVILYGTECLELTKTDIARIDNCFNLIFTKLFGTFNKAIITSCQYYTDCMPLSYIYDLRRINFVSELHSLSGINSVVYAIHKLLGNHECSGIINKYKFSVNDSKAARKAKVWNAFKSVQ